MAEFKSFFKTVGGNEGNKCQYPHRLDLYGCGCSHDCSYCVDPKTSVMLPDGKTKKIKDLNINDEIMGFDETFGIITSSFVLNKWFTYKTSYIIKLENGKELICSGNHRWLTQEGWKYTLDEKKGAPGPFLKEGDIIIGFKEDSNASVKSIEKHRNNQELVDITTSTETFIANGMISHNCYAKSLLDFRNLWNPQDPSTADIEKVKKKIQSIAKKGEIKFVRLGGMTDCFQPIEKIHKLTYETIKLLNEHKISYLIVTKSDLVASDEYINILDKELAHIQITVTTTDDDLSLTYEKATVPSKRIAAIEKLQAAGFDVALRLSPFIPDYIDFDILNNVKCDKIQVEFLRVNSWIRKWFDIDYSDYTVRQSNYYHLPLDKKKELLKNITGFKYISVCEDEDEAYKYFKENFNPNPDDCCNIRTTN